MPSQNNKSRDEKDNCQKGIYTDEISRRVFYTLIKAHFLKPSCHPHLTISSRGRHLAEIAHGLLARHPVLPHLLQLALVLLEGFLLVLGDQVVEVGAAVARRHVPGGTDVEDPVRREEVLVSGADIGAGV